jgi:copper chaperone CopZ
MSLAAKLQFQIEGMHCGACVQRVTRVLNQVPGTQVEEVRVGAARLSAERSDAEPYLTAIRKAGFEAHVVE